MIKWSDPIAAKSLEKGVYRVLVTESKFNQLHSDCKKLLGDRVIMIGRTTERNLPQRIGEFLAAASGRKVPHAEGITFYERRKNHGLSVSDLEIEYKACECPKCEEYTEFERFLKETGRERPYLCKNKPRICQEHPHRI